MDPKQPYVIVKVIGVFHEGILMNLEKAVIEKCKEGYEPVGGPSLERLGGLDCAFQAMVPKEDAKEDK